MTDLSAFSLEGKTVLVTGANTGIGQGIAVAVARAGAHVLGAGRSEMNETERTIAEFRGLFTAVDADLSEISRVKALLPELWERHGPIDGLVNNAGIIRRADAVDVTEEDWDAVLDLNVKALFFLAQSFAHLAIGTGRRGKIVNIASVLSAQGGIRVPAYAASKHAVLGLTRALCNEWAQKNININAIAPGYVESNNTAALRADAERSASILARIPAGRWGRPQDIGEAAVFLLSAASDYVHGSMLSVDGGWLAR